MTDETTAHLHLPLPHAGNTLAQDVARLRAALRGIDSQLWQVAAQVAGLPDMTQIVATLQADIAERQPLLLSGETIKTVGGVSLLGSGDVAVGDVLYGTADPDNGAGKHGDVYLQANGRVWKKAAGAWTYTGIRFAPHPALEVKAAAFVAADGGDYACNTSGGAFVVTPPAAPATGARFRVRDYGRSFHSNNLTIATAAHKVLGVAENYVIDQQDASRAFVYVDAAKGWMVTP